MALVKSHVFPFPPLSPYPFLPFDGASPSSLSPLLPSSSSLSSLSCSNWNVRYVVLRSGSDERIQLTPEPSAWNANQIKSNQIKI